MHPNPGLQWTDRAAMLDFVQREGFATISLPVPGVLHVPLVVDGDGVQFHVARRNRMIDQIDGERVVASVIGRHAYHSGSWYASPDAVPTWHYEAVEIEGVARTLSREALTLQLDRMAAIMEPRYAPDEPWTREAVKPATIEALLDGIIGFEVMIDDVRGTRKFNQTKKGADFEASIEGQRKAGRDDIVAAMMEMKS